MRSMCGADCGCLAMNYQSRWSTASLNLPHGTPAPSHPALRRHSGEAGGAGEIGNLLPNNQRQRRTCYALCHILYPVSAADTSIFRLDSNSTSF